MRLAQLSSFIFNWEAIFWLPQQVFAAIPHFYNGCRTKDGIGRAVKRVAP